MSQENYKVWFKGDGYADRLYRRATGELDEMESSKSLCAVLSPLYQPGMKVLDVGCGPGHYLRSLRSRLDEGIDYTGMDATEAYVDLAKRAFPDQEEKFRVGDIYDLPFEGLSYDIVTCSNLILHLPPPPSKPLSELIRVSKGHVVIRTLIGQGNYVIKEMVSPDELKGLPYPEEEGVGPDGKVEFHLLSFINMYTEKYIRDTVRNLDPKIKIRIEPDKKWEPFDNTSFAGSTGTTVIGDKQVAGKLIYDWNFIILNVIS